MALNDLERYLDDLKSNEELQSALAGATSADDMVANVMRSAGANGYSLTEEEVRSHMNTVNAERQLSDQELDSIGGGTLAGAWSKYPCG